MQSIDLNLASRPFRNNALIWLAVLLVGVGVIATSWWNVSRWKDYRDRFATVDTEASTFVEQMDDLDRRIKVARNKESKYEVRVLARETDKANEVIEWKAFSWTRLFNRLEKVSPWNVRMLEISPIFRGSAGEGGSAQLTQEDDKSIPVQIQGISQDYRALLDLQRKLFDDPHFENPVPQRSSVNERNETQFTLGFTYYPDKVPGSEEEPAADEDAADAEETAVADKAAAEKLANAEQQDRAEGKSSTSAVKRVASKSNGEVAS